MKPVADAMGTPAHHDTPRETPLGIVFVVFAASITPGTIPLRLVFLILLAVGWDPRV